MEILVIIALVLFSLVGVSYLALTGVAEYQAGQERLKKMQARHDKEREEFAAWKAEVTEALNIKE